MRYTLALLLFLAFATLPYVLVAITLGEWDAIAWTDRQKWIAGFGGGFLCLLIGALIVVEYIEKGKI